MIQTLIVAVIVAFAAWQLLRTFLPKKTVKPSGGCSSCDTCGACKTIRFDTSEPRKPR